MFKTFFLLIVSGFLLGVAPAMAQINQSPSVSAGPDRAVRSSSENIMLSASARDGDGYITSYAWTKVSGGAATIKSSNTPKTYVTGLSSGNYVFRITVTDNKGATANDTITLSASSTINRAPRISPAADITVLLPVDYFIVNCNASDPDGDTITYQWSQLSGGALSLSGGSTSTLTVTNSVPGLYVFRVKATDPAGLVTTDDIVVNVKQGTNKPPIVSAGADKTIQLPVNSVNLNAIASDPEKKSLVYNWSKVSGGLVNFSSTTTASTTVSNLSQGTYIFRAKVSDPLNASASDDVHVTVLPVNVAPVVNAGIDQTVNFPANSVTLNAVASDSDGTIASYAWTKVSGNTVTLNTANTAQLNVANMIAGTYVFRVTVIDDKGAISSDDVSVVVNGAAAAPTVNAGTDRSIQLPYASLGITATATPASGRSIASWSWSKVGGDTVKIEQSNVAKLVINDLKAGIYIFRVTVTDNQGESASDDITVTANASVGSYGRHIPVRSDTDRFASAPLYRYYEYLPPSYNTDTTKKYPLIIFLHGIGELSSSDNDIGKLTTAGGLARIVHNGNFPDPDKFIVISPQGAEYFSPYRVRDFVNQLAQRYRIDTKRMYVTGLSYGAMAIWDYGNAYGETANNIFAAMAPIAGSGDYVNGCKYKNIPVWAFHGKKDTNGSTLVGASILIVDRINACNPTTRAKLTVYTDGTHSGNTWDVTYDLSGFNKAQEADWDLYKSSLYDWFLQYSKP